MKKTQECEKTIPHLWTDKTDILKVATFSIYRHTTSAIKIPVTFFKGIENNPKTHMEAQKFLHRQRYLEFKKSAGNRLALWVSD